MIIKKSFQELSEKELMDIYNIIQDSIRYEQLALTPANLAEEDGTAFLYYLSARKKTLFSVMLCYDMEDYLEIAAYTAPGHRCRGYFTSLLQALMADAGDTPVCIYTDGNSYDALVTLEAMGSEYSQTEHIMRLDQMPQTNTAVSDRVSLQLSEKSALPALSRLHSAAFSMEEADSAAFLEQASESGDQIWSIVNRDGILIGLVITSIQSSETCLYGLAIDPAHQRNGYAAAAVRLLCSIPEVTYPITLHVSEENEPAYRLYKHLGFVSVQELMEYWY